MDQVVVIAGGPTVGTPDAVQNRVGAQRMMGHGYWGPGMMGPGYGGHGYWGPAHWGG